MNIAQPPFLFLNIVTIGPTVGSTLKISLVGIVSDMGYLPEDISFGVKCGDKSLQHAVQEPQGTSETGLLVETDVKLILILCICMNVVFQFFKCCVPVIILFLSNDRGVLRVPL